MGNDAVLTSSRAESFIEARLDAEIAVQVTGQREPWDDDISDVGNHESHRSSPELLPHRARLRP